MKEIYLFVHKLLEYFQSKVLKTFLKQFMRISDATGSSGILMHKTL